MHSANSGFYSWEGRTRAGEFVSACCLAEPNIVYFYRDKHSKIPWNDSNLSIEECRHIGRSEGVITKPQPTALKIVYVYFSSSNFPN